MKRILLVSSIIFVTGLYSNPLDINETDKEIFKLTFNAQVAKADSLLNMLIEKYPDNPKYYALKTPFLFYSRYFAPGTANSNDSLRNLILDFGQKAIALAEDDESIQAKFYAGVASGFISRVHMTRGEYMDAYFSARDSENYFEDVLESDPDNIDALLGLAVVEYFVENNLNGFTYAVAWTLGFSGDRYNALENFQKVAERGQLFNHEARFALAFVNRFTENDINTAEKMYANLNNDFPNNIFIENQYRQTRFIKLVNDKGADYLFENIERLRQEYNITNANILNGLGYQLLNQNQIDDAIKIFTINLEIFPDLANCYDSLAEGYMMNGQNEQAIKYYKLAYDKLPQDSTINEQFREVLKTGIEERLSELGAEVSI